MFFYILDTSILVNWCICYPTSWMLLFFEHFTALRFCSHSFIVKLVLVLSVQMLGIFFYIHGMTFTFSIFRMGDSGPNVMLEKEVCFFCFASSYFMLDNDLWLHKTSFVLQ